MSNPNELQYESNWKSIVNVLKSSNLKLSRIAKAGSRAKQRHRPDSDQDVIFAVSGNPLKGTFYPELVTILERNFPQEKAYLGSNYNVVHLDFRSGAKFDLVLLSEGKFDEEHEGIKDFRRHNL